MTSKRATGVKISGNALHGYINKIWITIVLAKHDTSHANKK